jgi:XapX domain-containing protein
MKIIIGLVLATGIGVLCRLADVPLPAPPVLIGALLVVAMSSGSAVTRLLMRIFIPISQERPIDARRSSARYGQKENAMFGLTSLGVIHTAISLVALAAGIAAFFRYGKISPGNASGKLYIVATILVCLTGFGIFQHGGFGKPHVLGIVTLIALAVAAIAGRTALFGKASLYVETFSYSATFFFHMIPTIAEGATRLPYGAPLFDNQEAPELQLATGIVFLIFLIGASYQVRHLRTTS